MIATIGFKEDLKRVCRRVHKELSPFGVSLSAVQEALSKGLGARNFDGALSGLPGKVEKPEENASVGTSDGALTIKGASARRAGLNPFLSKCSPDLAVEAMAALLPNDDDGSFWRSRATGLLALLPDLAGPGGFADMAAVDLAQLLDLNAIAAKGGSLEEGAKKRVCAYLNALPCFEQGSSQPAREAREQHGYLTAMLWPLFSQIGSLERFDPVLLSKGGPSVASKRHVAALGMGFLSLLWERAETGRSDAIRVSDALAMLPGCFDEKPRRLLSQTLRSVLSSPAAQAGLASFEGDAA